MTNRAFHIRSLCEDMRQAYQVLCMPDAQGVTVRFMDDHLGNPDLKFPPVHMSHKDFLNVIPHNDMTMATYHNALERGDSYGLLVDPRVIAHLARWGDPTYPQRDYQHILNKRHTTDDDVTRDRMIAGRV